MITHSILIKTGEKVYYYNKLDCSITLCVIDSAPNLLLRGYKSGSDIHSRIFKASKEDIYPYKESLSKDENYELAFNHFKPRISNKIFDLLNDLFIFEEEKEKILQTYLHQL